MPNKHPPGICRVACAILVGSALSQLGCSYGNIPAKAQLLREHGASLHYDSFDDACSVSITDLSDYNTIVAELQSASPPLDAMYFSNVNVSNALLLGIRQLPTVKEVAFYQCSQSTALSAKTMVTVLTIQDCQRPAEILSAFPEVSQLTLGSNDLTSEVVERLNAFPKMASLNIICNPGELELETLERLVHVVNVAILGPAAGDSREIEIPGKTVRDYRGFVQ